MVTDEILCAVHGMVDLFDTPEARSAGEAIWKMLADFDEDSWHEKVDSGTVKEWQQHYIKTIETQEEPFMGNLYFVTFHPTDTQFVIEQENKEKGLESAIEANKIVGEMEDIDITDKEYYAIEEIDSFEKLKTHLKRQDYYAETNDAVIFDND